MVRTKTTTRYTLARSCLADPDLGFMAEDERIVPVAAALLEDDPVLLSFVVYDRTPGDSARAKRRYPFRRRAADCVRDRARTFAATPRRSGRATTDSRQVPWRK